MDNKWKQSLARLDIRKIVKIAVGSSIAILIADMLGLKYSASAGIITLLSIQNTKKETLLVAGRRVLAFLLAIVIAYILFESFGYNTITFGVFLLLFISFSYLIHLQDGISMCSVLVTHFLIEETMKLSFVENEFGILIIGTIVGILLNLYIPSNMKIVREDIKRLEEDMKIILYKLGDCIVKPRLSSNTDSNKSCRLDITCNCQDTCSLNDEFALMDEHLKSSMTRAYENMNNTLLTNTRYYIQYYIMRRNQYNILKRIKEQLCLLTIVPKQAVTLSKFLHEIADQFSQYNNVKKLLEELDRIKEGYKSEENPKTREEFENRAVLYLILNDIETFLLMKRNFILSIDNKQMESLWKSNH